MNIKPFALAFGVMATCLLLGLTPAAHAEVVIQCPPDIDGIDTDGDGIVDNDNICFHMGAGDGFVTMADGREQYLFSFSDLNRLPGTIETGMPAVSFSNLGEALPAEGAIMRGMLSALFPAPTIEIREGQRVYLTLTNVGMMIRPDLPDPHSIHFHGFPQAAPIFDGVPDSSIAVNMGSSFTYVYNIVTPGTFMWHCHMEATEHMQMGMLGNLYVKPIQNMEHNKLVPSDLKGFIHVEGYEYAYNDGDGSTYYDVDFPIQLSGFDPKFHDASFFIRPLPFAMMEDRYPMINGRGYPDTVVKEPLFNGRGDPLDPVNPGSLMPPVVASPLSALIEATKGQKILLRFSSLSTTRFHTITTLGIPMHVVGKGAHILRGPGGEDLSFTTNSVTLGGGEAKDVILDTSDIDAGTYFLYSTNLDTLANNEDDFGGMMTEIIISAVIPE